MKRDAIVICGLAVGTLALAGCAGETRHDKPPTPVRLQTVEARPAGAGVRYSANIVAKDQVSLSFKQSGYLSAIARVEGVDGHPRDLHEGDRVERGAVLARLRDGEYADRAQEARAGLAEAEATLQHARLDSQRAEALYKTQSLTEPDHDAATRNLGVAEARVEGARAQMQEAETALADCALKAPFSGVLTSASLEVGQLVTPGMAAFELADLTSVKAVFGVSDVMLKDLTLGAGLSVQTESVPAVDFRGRISRIAPSADPKSRVFEVELTIPNADSRLRPGMIAALQVSEAARAAAPAEAPAPVVRLSAIIRPPGEPEGYGLFVIQDDAGAPVARLRKVTLGEALGNSIVVTSGLALGERVIVIGATLVNDGERVRIVP